MRTLKAGFRGDEPMIMFTPETTWALMQWLRSHEWDIAAGINDFGELKQVYCDVIGEEPKCEH